MFNKNKIIIKIEGMSCKGCAKKIETSLKTIENIKKVKVNLNKKEAIIESNEKLDIDKIKDRICSLGYEVD